MSSPIEAYALLGDCRGAALSGRDGSIDWLCWPRFDSPACFAALLGTSDHGRWLLAPVEEPARTERSYRAGTLVLETSFESAAGRVALIEFMVFRPEDGAPQLVRIVEGCRGTVPMRMELTLRFDYGNTIPWVTREADALRAIAGPDTVWLTTKVATRGENLRTIAEFTVRAGERIAFTLTHAGSLDPAPAPIEAERALADTEATWRAWSRKSNYQGDYREAVERSLITLKALTYRPSGGIVAAPTTSLPEQLGGARNWDYRFCWVRDATIMLYALLVSGYTDEAAAWRNWLLRAVAGSPAQAQVLYGVAAERQVQELELPWLPGYANSSPVRIGNAASTQLQLDTFGELMDAMYQCRHNGLENAAGWALERQLLNFLEQVWAEPDEGIWEIRGPRRQFTHSKVMAWVAFDRGIRSIEQFGTQGPLERWRAVRQQIHDEVCARGFSCRLQAFTQSYGSDELDASLLLLPLVGFLPATDPRVASTISAIERELLVDDTFVLRYRTRRDLDGLPEGEGAFLACSFWLVSNRVMQGRMAEARTLFERLLALRNDVGLLAEEYDPRLRRLVGNFPQAFSHVALVDAAVSLSNAEENPADHRMAPHRTTKSGANPGRR